MSFDAPFALHPSGNAHLNQPIASVGSNSTQTTAVQTIAPNQAIAHSNKSFASDAASFLIPVGFIGIWTVAILIAMRGWKAAQNEVKTNPYLCQSPCRNCQFFSNNFYLKCAVHPTTVLTTEAHQCSDYSPKQAAESSTYKTLADNTKRR